MNGISKDDPLSHGPSGIDPELLLLFDQAAPVSTNDETFLAAMMGKVRRARRMRLLARSILTTSFIVLGALLAPYVAQATLSIVGWATLYYPVGCVCAALIAWRTARRRSY